MHFWNMIAFQTYVQAGKLVGRSKCVQFPNEIATVCLALCVFFHDFIFFRLILVRLSHCRIHTWHRTQTLIITEAVYSKHLNSAQMQRKCRQSFSLGLGCLLCMALVGLVFLVMCTCMCILQSENCSIFSLSRWNRNHKPNEKNDETKRNTKPICSLLAHFLRIYCSKALLMHQLFFCIFGCRSRAQ